MIKSLFHRLLRSLGYEIHPYSPPKPTRLECFFSIWKTAMSAPDFIIDVGANHGRWTRSALDYFPKTEFLMVEPQERLRKHSEDLLAQPNIKWTTAGISDQTGKLKLSLPERDDGASFLNADKDPAIPSIEVDVLTLDSIVTKEEKIPDIVKIDAEGFDLKALKGASQLLGKTAVFFVECAVCAPDLENTLTTVCDFMSKYGYRVFDVSDLNYSPQHQVLWLVEIIFIKDDSDVWKAFASY
ncbi:MAG: FkbM family methyltransferase [Chthoniobacterales bacterium]